MSNFSCLGSQLSWESVMIQISGGLASKHIPILPLVNVGSHTLSCQFHVNFKYIASGLCLCLCGIGIGHLCWNWNGISVLELE